MRLFLILLACLVSTPAHALDFIFKDGQSLAALQQSDPVAYAFYEQGIQNGANLWRSRIPNNITLNINVDIGSFAGAGSILMAAGPNGGLVPYNEVRDRLVDLPNALPEAPPVFNTGSQTITADSTYINLMSSQMKALGVFDTLLRLQQSDGFIKIGTDNNYFLDQNNPQFGAFDFTALFAHELGHIMGVISNTADMPPTEVRVINPTLMDMYRFSAPHMRDISSSLSQKYFSRDDGLNDADGGPIDLFFAIGTYAGGPQASHYDGGYTKIFQPGFGSGAAYSVTNADTLLLTTVFPSPTIGVGAPEPSTLSLVALIAFLYARIFWINIRERR